MGIYLKARNKESWKRAGEVIKKGGIILHPTDTVYGLATHAFKLRPLRILALLKGRSVGKPFLVLANQEQFFQLVKYIPYSLKEIWEDFIKHPITAILWSKRKFPYTTKEGKIAMRIPFDPLTLMILKEANAPLASTSANPPGILHSTRESISFFSKMVDLVILGKPGGTISSTIIDFTAIPPKILRKGVYPDQSPLRIPHL